MEIAQGMDVPSSVIPKLKPVAPQRYKTLPFLRAAPFKVILAFAASSGFIGSTETVVPGQSRQERLSTDIATEHPHSPEFPRNTGMAAERPPELLKILGEGRERAAKDDDARIPIELWDEPFWSHLSNEFRTQHQFIWVGGFQKPLLDCLRAWILRLWRRRVYLSFRGFMKTKYGSFWHRSDSEDTVAGRDCLRRTAAADFWEWHAGSRLFFWRWPEESRDWARDGHPIFLFDTPPAYRKPQPLEPDPDIHQRVKEKLEKFIAREYISQDGWVTGLVSYFTVPKGDSDVRVVFDGTKSGLNGVIWAPTFGLPTVDSLLPLVEPGTWQGDIDVAEQFYNYMLDPRVQPYCGVDVTPYLGDIKGRLRWLTWVRCVMGLRSSPHGCVKMHHLGEEIIRGDHTDPTNPFFFDQLRLNLPGDPEYNPCLARVFKLNSNTGRNAGDMVTYVDDVRPTAATFGLCLRLCHRVGSILGYLGIQDAARKRVPPSQRAGAWTGSVVHTDNDMVVVLCTQEKWDKARSVVLEIQRVLREDQGNFDYKTLEQQRGFLVYVSRTYPLLVPYLKGIHLTLDSWRPYRDKEGWKDLSQIQFHLDSPDIPTEHPEVVHAVPRLAFDIQGLLTLMHSPTPPRRLIRSKQVLMVIYGFGDASGSGFGSTTTTPQGVRYRYGLWGDDLAGRSSNFREMFNIADSLTAEVASLDFAHLTHMVDALEQESTKGLLHHTEFFMFTDNAVAEGAFFKGTSTNKHLFELVLRLKRLEFDHSLKLNVIHVSGRRMVAQGTDGLSRGDLSDGVLQGHPFLDFVPLHESAMTRSSGIQPWCLSWLPPSSSLLPLRPEDWYGKGHGILGGTRNPDGLWVPTIANPKTHMFLWAPPPAAADVAVEQLGLSRHKRPDFLHIFICPRLMTHLWRKRLY